LGQEKANENEEERGEDHTTSSDIDENISFEVVVNEVMQIDSSTPSSSSTILRNAFQAASKTNFNTLLQLPKLSLALEEVEKTILQSLTSNRTLKNRS
jgi:hypothetical protein